MLGFELLDKDREVAGGFELDFADELTRGGLDHQGVAGRSCPLGVTLIVHADGRHRAAIVNVRVATDKGHRKGLGIRKRLCCNDFGLFVKRVLLRRGSLRGSSNFVYEQSDAEVNAPGRESSLSALRVFPPCFRGYLEVALALGIGASAPSPPSCLRHPTVCSKTL